ncbi:MAG: Arsenical pump membrane protein [Promethearchaeota archaeon]|nr:MAG: Arsenical pump membrane protein [Candidatus Lokiarchaeota archaeon]
MEPILLIISFVAFAFILISYSFEKIDFVSVSIVSSFICATIVGLATQTGIEGFIGFIEFDAILVILSMSIITQIAMESNILEFIAVKLFKISGGDQRIFFYLLCIITTLLAAIITDLVVVLILAPITIRLCRFLKIRAGTYLLGMTICINIGSIITPFSSGENIIISDAFKLDTLYFISNYWIFSFLLLFLTIFLIDRFLLSKEPMIEIKQKKYVLDLVDASVMIKNKKMFYANSIAIIITILLFAILPLLYLTATLAAFILVLINKRFTKKKAGTLLRDIEWEIVFFFLSLYIMIGCLTLSGFEELIQLIPFNALNPVLLSLVILIAVSLISGLVANTPTALVFIPIIRTLIDANLVSSIPILFAFIIGINLGGNLIPQGAACDVMTLKIAQDNGVENLNYKRLLKVGATFAVIHIFFSIGYLFLLNLIYP